MDYVVGSVAALISGNVTPNRPKVLKRALTPMKHQQSPNVTPKSELVSDRSIFLSPTMQKKKAIVKKSPKRIFQSTDIDEDTENNANSSLVSPKADKVKKHLKDDLDSDINVSLNILSPQSPKNKVEKSPSPKKKLSYAADNEQDVRVSNENTPKKKKKKISLATETSDNCGDTNVDSEHKDDSKMEVEAYIEKNTPKKKKKSNTFTVEKVDSTENQTNDEQETNLGEKKDNKKSKKDKKKAKMLANDPQENGQELDDSQDSSVNKENEMQESKKKNKKRKKKAKNSITKESEECVEDNTENVETKSDNVDESEYINPNAITNKDTDSEHESDDEIESENEESNKAVLDTGPEPSSDEEEETKPKKGRNLVEEDKEHVSTEEEVKRTLFVGNVPFSSKCKKDIKRIFSKYGDIETVRIRTVPVKDARVTPKLAVIKNELHPDRSTVNVYIKYKYPSSVDEALVENKTVLNDHHLRVARSDVTGSEHDPKCSIFVGNIPFALEDEGLRAKFEKCGEIESVRIIRDKKTNAGKGFGYVNFTSKDGVELALALTEEDLTIKNRIIRVKRCTQPTTNKQRHQSTQRKQYNQRQNYQSRDNNQRQNYLSRDNNQRPNYQSRVDNQRQNYQSRDNNQGQNYQSRQQNQRGQYNNQRGMSQRFQNRDQNADGKGEGAYRRIMNKRKPQDGNEGPPNKRQRNLNQPNREKKTRKEFVGMTAEKKKFQKRKLNKDQKKKKAFSEILTKASQS